MYGSACGYCSLSCKQGAAVPRFSKGKDVPRPRRNNQVHTLEDNGRGVEILRERLNKSKRNLRRAATLRRHGGIILKTALNSSRFAQSVLGSAYSFPEHRWTTSKSKYGSWSRWWILSVSLGRCSSAFVEESTKVCQSADSLVNVVLSPE
ncbi:hypothetical protein BJY00DRAFT_283285 [Aspergillus carlsbadensis]|nr:hypothetical protein BJY00DRAFT_283285 [Aspergillus carlsbadensis]